MKLHQAFLMASMLSFSSTAMAAVDVIQDGTFQNAIGTGNNLTPWSDWTNAGVTRHAAPVGISGNYASLSWGADLFQRFSAPAPGMYILSFYVQNPMPYATKMIIDIQQPSGFGWHLMDKVISLAASTDFELKSFHVDINRTEGEASEFYFSNSYNYPDPNRGFEGTVNPRGTFLNVAQVSLRAVPESATWTMMMLGFGAVGYSLRQRRTRLVAIA